MKKLLYCTVLTLVIALFTSYPVLAEDIQKAQWFENDPSVAIYDDPLGVNLYYVEYNNIRAEEISTSDNIHLLMIDGGFVPNPEIIIENGRTLVPIRIISDMPGVKVEWDDSDKTIKITDKGTQINLSIGSDKAQVNGVGKTLDSPAIIFNSSTYVPLRFIGEALEASIQYVPALDYENEDDDKTPGWLLPRKKVSIVVIERAAYNEKTFTVEEGLAEVKKASAQEYADLIAFYEETGNTFNENQKDYDSQAIMYANFDIGRYYIFKLEGMEDRPIWYNKYTGEIYSEKAGLPFVNIEKGFINITWIYQ